ncbi:MAG TPA: hypothetical protein VJQ56_14230 [Blastocatellia bacterium]|nr:hypothetical protein [Blastocatellia bacterium]
MIAHSERYQGEIAKSALVTTNDPAHPSFNLVLRAYVKHPAPAASSPAAKSPTSKEVGPFLVSPTNNWIASTISGDAIATRLYLYNNGPTPVHIKNVNPGGKSFSVGVKPIEDGKRYEVVVATDPTLKPGQYKQTAIITTDSKTSPEVPVYLDLTILPKVVTMPVEIIMPQLPTVIDLATLSLPKIYVRKARGDGLVIKSVKSTVPFVTPILKTQSEGRFYTVDLMFANLKKMDAGEIKGKIIIETNDDERPTIEVPIRFAFK